MDEAFRFLSCTGNSGEFRLTITTDSTNDFVFDDVTVTGKSDSSEVSAAAAKRD